MIGPESYSFCYLLFSSLMDSYLLTLIWQLRSYFIPLLYFWWGRLSNSAYQCTYFLAVYSPSAISSRETELFSFMLDFGAHINKNSKFISWDIGGSHLRMNLIADMRFYYGCFHLVLYVSYTILTKFSFWISLSSYVIICEYF
jgi:hypothetical protein